MANAKTAGIPRVVSGKDRACNCHPSGYETGGTPDITMVMYHEPKDVAIYLPGIL